ncbi:acyltransferase [Sphaerisporangium rufum]|uniref:Acyltransferase n=1 Tax=Sphaerisporangium rufum TaxID=1381558 RepID=A0A919UZ06_9ACTN|nr:acyltransferase family protein [Sphaerisporangium rufum]GII77294.1 acyltransferase [Sphaerisporangium rufum]
MNGARPVEPAAGMAGDVQARRAGTGYAARLAAATPPDRDRGIDALRALAIAGVIIGHWLVTAWLVDAAGNLRVTSPLAFMPGLAPLSWVLQTLAVFFFVGGRTAAGGLARAGDPRAWLRRRAGRLLRPAGPLLAMWAALLAAAAAGGVPMGTLRALVVPALGPLWFLAVFGLLTVATPLLVRVRPTVLVLGAVAVVLAVDAARFALDSPSWVGWVNVAAGWLVPYALGLARARGALTGRRAAGALLAGGAAATVVLVVAFGYPAAMIGVTGARVSNLSPPTLAAVSFGVAQVGLALLLHGPLSALMRRPRLWAGVATANVSAMTVFLWHQTALTAVMLAVLPVDSGAPGLLAPPGSPAWLLHRMCWLPIPAALVAAACAAVARRGRSGGPLESRSDGNKPARIPLDPR